MDIVKLYDAKTQLSALVERAAAGEEIIIAKGDRPVAMLVPIRDRLEPRKPSGLLKGKIDEAFKQADREIERMFHEETDDLAS